MQTVRELLAKLDHPFEWTRNGLTPALKRLDAVLGESVPGRDTYQLPDGSAASVYYEGARVYQIEMTLDVFRRTASLTDLEYEDKVDEYFSKYNSFVEEAKTALGDPQFDHGFGCEGFPEDQDAVWLALWNLGDSRAMIQQKHEDREMPFRVVLIYAPATES